MSVLIAAPLIVIGIVLYIYIGIKMARITVHLIRSGDRESWVAFLMMPVRCYRRDSVRIQRNENDLKALTAIVAFNVMLWPIKIVWNAVGFLVFGPLLLLRRVL